MTFLTVQQGIDRITRQKKRTIGEVSDQLWFDFFNALNFPAYEWLAKLEPENYITTHTFSVVSGTEAYTEPVDLKWIRTGESGYFDTDSLGKRTRPQLQKTQIDSSCYGYFRRGGQTYFTPSPTADRTVLLDYIPSIAVITAKTDSLVINDEHLALVMQWLMKEYGEWNLQQVVEMSADARFARELKNMLANIAVEPQTFIL